MGKALKHVGKISSPLLLKPLQLCPVMLLQMPQ
jgi:hypothetical protein